IAEGGIHVFGHEPDRVARPGGYGDLRRPLAGKQTDANGWRFLGRLGGASEHGRRDQERGEPDRRGPPLHSAPPFGPNAANTRPAIGAASRPPEPSSRNTTTTISGRSAGANPANHPWPAAVPVFPATSGFTVPASRAVPDLTAWLRPARTSRSP